MADNKGLSLVAKVVIISVVVIVASIAVTVIVFVSNPNLPFSPFKHQIISSEKYAPSENYTVNISATNGNVNIVPDSDGWTYAVVSAWTYFSPYPELNVSTSILNNSYSYSITSPWFTLRGPEITVYVPSGLECSGLNVNDTNGNLNVNLPATSHHVYLFTKNGNIKIESQDVGELNESTSNGNIDNYLVSVKNLSMTTRNGNINLEVTSKLTEGFQNISTTNGNIVVRIHPSSLIDVSATVTNGKISVSSLSIVTSVLNDRVLIGSLNGGGGIMNVKTTNGNILLSAA